MRNLGVVLQIVGSVVALVAVGVWQPVVACLTAGLLLVAVGWSLEGRS